MYKVVGFWGLPKPGEVEAFEKYYWETHVPLARRVPHLRKLVLTKMENGLEGTAAPFYRVAELHFDGPEQLARASESSQWRAMRADAGKMVERFGVTIEAGMGWERD
ncbi:MAG TPA: EthD family reductase [Candidatus Binataceae bacterium]|nr:EthD family reductase [Candidatus Binataceae bacterium]